MVLLKAVVSRENLKSSDSATTQLENSDNIEANSVIFLAAMIDMLFEFSAYAHK